MPGFPKDILKGEKITADWLNRIVAYLLTMITGGNGILVKRHGNKIVIELAQGKVQGGGSGSTILHKADVRTNLPDLAAASNGHLGLATDPQKLYYRTSDSSIGSTPWRLIGRVTTWLASAYSGSLPTRSTELEINVGDLGLDANSKLNVLTALPGTWRRQVNIIDVAGPVSIAGNPGYDLYKCTSPSSGTDRVYLMVDGTPICITHFVPTSGDA